MRTITQAANSCVFKALSARFLALAQLRVSRLRMLCFPAEPADVRFGSIFTEIRCLRYVRFPPDRNQIADVAALWFRAMNGLCLHENAVPFDLRSALSRAQTR
jgi:hypothetical protein